ncbi:MAG: response regulator [Fuerstiella sp.]
MGGTTAERVLVVDDEKNMRITLADILLDQGYEVDVAASGHEAVKLCSENGYRVIPLDVRMPGIDGVETYRQIRQKQEGVRVIMMSACTMEESKEAVLAHGAVAFLAKPLDIDRVVKLVGEIRDTSILVVENDEVIAFPLKDRLKEQAYRVALTRTPQEALELAKQIQFDLIFIEAKLPDMNGLELYLAIKEVNPNAVTIMICDPDEEFTAIASEAVRYTTYSSLQKPLDLDHVIEVLDRNTNQQASNRLRKPVQDTE